GHLAVDLAPPRLLARTGPVKYWLRGSERWTQQTVHVDYDAAGDRTTELVRYEKWRDGELVAAELHPFVLQHWALDAFAALLTEAGFTDLTVTANYRRDRRPGPRDDDWTFHATRP
ncbi:MAG TPA: hypothetical protein VK894_00555, partial [Jiangellales bacterium]|nr:hypothetical protein [Jiangellales bacterium]